MTKPAQRKQQGVALVAVLMIIAIVVVIAVNMTGRLQLQLQRGRRPRRRAYPSGCRWRSGGASRRSRAPGWSGIAVPRR